MTEVKHDIDWIDGRTERKMIRLRDRFDRDIRRLENYLSVLVKIKNGEHIQSELYVAEFKKLSNYINKQIENTDYLIRLLKKLKTFDMGKKSLDEVNRMDIGIQSDRIIRLLKNGAYLTDEEKQNIILFINAKL